MQSFVCGPDFKHKKHKTNIFLLTLQSINNSNLKESRGHNELWCSTPSLPHIRENAVCSVPSVTAKIFRTFHTFCKEGIEN